MRAPVANIKGFISLYNRSTDTEDNTNIIKYVEKSAVHLDEILTDLNLILKNKNSQLEDKEKINFDDFIENLKQSMFVEIESSGTMIIKKFDVNQTIFTVKSVLNSIVYNLLQNAIKYKKNWESPLISIEFFTVETNYLIKISDNGIGIDLGRFKDRVFSLYSRFHQNADGKGIGLYLVKTQVELLGGTISIESKVNVGTSFEIIIPINR
jgi:signal transduction histidine kinase